MRGQFSFEGHEDGSVVLDIGERCIMTTAREAHRALFEALLEDRVSGARWEKALDTLADFLNTADFATIRAAHPELSRIGRCRVRVYRGKDGAVRWEKASSLIRASRTGRRGSA
jgi:hypothetical protein